MLDLRVTQNKAIVDIANMANKEMVIGKDRFEAGRPNLFADGNYHGAECR